MIPLVIASAALVVLLTGWFLYPLILSLLPRQPLPGQSASDSGSDAITVVIATREPPPVIGERVASLRTTTWPGGLLRIVIGVDPNAATPFAAYRETLEDGYNVVVVSGDAPGGKAATLNAAMREVKTDKVVFADSAQQFDPGAIAALAEALDRPGVGGATGEIVTDAERGVFGLFWRYESALRQLESRAGIVVAVTGAIHALNRHCWRPLPAGLICDDLLIPLNVGRQGLRVEVAANAMARDYRSFTREVQLQRKVRTLTGMLQVCAYQPWVLNPWGHRLWGAFVCHKLIRIATPLLAVIILAGMVTLIPASMLVGTIAGALAVVAVLLLMRGVSLQTAVHEFHWTLRMLLAPVTAMGRALRGDWHIW
ncbi:MAG: glycosyltransferase [Gemmatimonadales bacterium]|nr:glycosyltransferase [Gemmatimonadales bacterium]MDZ4388996.1 glycosyltransferase [Gemmatimonadales bacterium]